MPDGVVPEVPIQRLAQHVPMALPLCNCVIDVTVETVVTV